MKINDIIAEAGILGSIATGAVRMLDKIGGGTGNVGTQAQIAARDKKEYARARATVGKTAFQEFADSLQQNKINLQDPRSYDPVEITDYLQNFARNYFVVGDRYHNQDQQKAIKVGVLQALKQMPLPTTINNISVQDYLEKANTERTSIINQVDKMMATQQAAQPATQDSTVGQSGSTSSTPLALGVEVIDSDPLILRYRNQDFLLNKSDQWVRFGGKKQTLADPDMATFLNKQLTRL